MMSCMGNVIIDVVANVHAFVFAVVIVHVIVTVTVGALPQGGAPIRY